MSGTPEQDARQEIVQLIDLSAELLAEAREHPSRRSARTVQSGPSMRATLIALASGAELAEHEAPPAASLQVISGRVRLHTEEQQWRLGEGDIVAIPPRRHGLEALTEAAVLLTVALH